MPDITKLIGLLEKLLHGPLSAIHIPPAVFTALALAVLVGLILAVSCWVLAKAARLKQDLQRLVPRFSA